MLQTATWFLRIDIFLLNANNETHSKSSRSNLLMKKPWIFAHWTYRNVFDFGRETLPAESHALNWGCLSFNEFFCASLDEIELRQSAELGALCARAGITVVDLVELMFRHIYPQHDLVPAHCLRPMMLLAHDNGMCKLLNSLGNVSALFFLQNNCWKQMVSGATSISCDYFTGSRLLIAIHLKTCC